MDIKLKMAQRQAANREIIEILSDMVEKYPDLRFGQILAITETLEYVPSPRPDDDSIIIKDPFNEESVDTWVRIRDKVMEFNKRLKSLKK
jgi:hypothetical protein